MIDAASATSGATTNSTSSRDTLAENFEMFLLLLTEQMKNQDPLSPLDSNEFVTQLVQFSGVEQSIRQNDHLETLVGLQVANVGGAAVGYLGKEVRVNSPIAPLGQNGASWAYEVAGDAESVSIAVLDSTGKVVFEATGEIETGEHGFLWDGYDNAGEPLPDGAYTLDISASTATGDSLPVYISSFGIVTGVDLSGTEPVLMLGQALAPFSLIEAVRDVLPPPPPADPDTDDETDTTTEPDDSTPST